MVRPSNENSLKARVGTSAWLDPTLDEAPSYELMDDARDQCLIRDALFHGTLLHAFEILRGEPDVDPFALLKSIANIRLIAANLTLAI